MENLSHPMEEYAGYICPICKGPLDSLPHALNCLSCGTCYPLVGAIPDFLAPAIILLDVLNKPQARRIRQADQGWLKTAAGLYESRLWYPLVISLYLGRNTTSLTDLVRRIKAALNVDTGRILDAACGTATYGRRFATVERAVYGIDLSLAMLRKGAEYIQRERVSNTHLARTWVESLPFPDDFFDFAICSGALHLFHDPVLALTEINRTLRPGARLVGMAMGVGSQGLVQYGWFRERLKKRGTVHLFEVPELEMDLRQAGFERLQLERLGSGIFFTADNGRLT